MYSRAAIARLVGLIRAGLLRIDGVEVTAFGLPDVNEAIAHAAANAGAFKATVLCP
ncbi:MAG TPA: hypothetical protein VFK05_39845 [Polyangiaceae bacterium]|nr:hypothetical protein [Polyangiaceae bacterium]